MIMLKQCEFDPNYKYRKSSSSKAKTLGLYENRTPATSNKKSPIHPVFWGPLFTPLVFPYASRWEFYPSTEKYSLTSSRGFR